MISNIFIKNAAGCAAPYLNKEVKCFMSVCLFYTRKQFLMNGMDAVTIKECTQSRQRHPELPFIQS